MAIATGKSLELTAQLSPLFGQLDEKMQACIKDCLACATVCEQTMAYSLRQGGKHAAPDHIQLLADCAEMCLMSARMMARGSSFHSRHCALCAQVCKACEESCEEFGNDAQMKACADACRTCHDACREMGSAA
jgi:hypothetical protein